HLAVDPDDAVVDGTCGAGSHRTTGSWARTQGGRGTPREVTLRSSGVDDEPPRAPGGTRDEHVPPPAAVPAARAREVPAQHLGHLTRELPREPRRSRRAAAHEQRPLPLDHGPRPDGPHAPLRVLEAGHRRRLVPGRGRQSITYRRSLTLGQKFDV